MVNYVIYRPASVSASASASSSSARSASLARTSELWSFERKNFSLYHLGIINIMMIMNDFE